MSHPTSPHPQNAPQPHPPLPHHHKVFDLPSINTPESNDESKAFVDEVEDDDDNIERENVSG